MSSSKQCITKIHTGLFSILSLIKLKVARQNIKTKSTGSFTISSSNGSGEFSSYNHIRVNLCCYQEWLLVTNLFVSTLIFNFR